MGRLPSLHKRVNVNPMLPIIWKVGCALHGTESVQYPDVPLFQSASTLALVLRREKCLFRGFRGLSDSRELTTCLSSASRQGIEPRR
jgi:hypothetical protein